VLAGRTILLAARLKREEIRKFQAGEVMMAAVQVIRWSCRPVGADGGMTVERIIY
jgi:hypothetical protein